MTHRPAKIWCKWAGSFPILRRITKLHACISDRFTKVRPVMSISVPRIDSVNHSSLRRRIATAAAAMTALIQTAATAQITSNADLERTVRNRFEGDRVARCLAVALIGEETFKAFVCSDPKRAQTIDDSSAFEIGSVTKTMLAFLVADLVDQGRMSLDKPLQNYLPEGSVVPMWKDKSVTVQHVLTHTSGIPRLAADMEITNPDDPYSTVTPKALLESLKKTKLISEPGSKLAYSNFAVMALSLAVTHTAKQDLEALLKRRLFEPTGMKAAYLSKPAANVTAAQGHNTSRKPVPPWTVAIDLGGVGMVRATLDDMVAYARAAIAKPALSVGRISAAERAASLIATAQKSLYKSGAEEVGMNWFRRKLAGGVEVAEHGGGTGGFSSYIVTDRANGRAVVALSDAAGAVISRFADSLLDAKVDAGVARRMTNPDNNLLKSLVGEYTVGGTLPASLRTRDGKLFIQAAGQPEFEMGFDTSGNFFVLSFEAVLIREGTGENAKLSWAQGGGVVSFTRRDPSAAKAEEAGAYKVATEKLSDYPGIYPLAPNFKLTFTVAAQALMVQATGQGALPLAAVSEDHFVADAVGVKVWFKRGADGKVNAIRFVQGGNDVVANRE
jgi:serine-type D-Ala-D-Ala carboxypeptidase/endopeptidase